MEKGNEDVMRCGESSLNFILPYSLYGRKTKITFYPVVCVMVFNAQSSIKSQKSQRVVRKWKSGVLKRTDLSKGLVSDQKKKEKRQMGPTGVSNEHEVRSQSL